MFVLFVDMMATVNTPDEMFKLYRTLIIYYDNNVFESVKVTLTMTDPKEYVVTYSHV